MDAPRTPLRHRFWRWFYNRLAFAYDPVLRLGERLRLGSEERIRRELFADIPLAPGELVIDVGCGTGALIPHLPSGVRYIGIDASLNMLRQARRKHAHANLVLADADALPLARSCAKLAIAMGMLQHTADPTVAVIQMRRSAQATGIVDEHHAFGRLQAAIPEATVSKTYKDYFVLFLQNKPHLTKLLGEAKTGRATIPANPYGVT
jgi:ubiquinone/menaquinone biosynthesis C-methylase UbiE